MTTTITTEQRKKLHAAFMDPNLRLGRGVGKADGARCTIAEINFVLFGKLSDESHPCMSEVVRHWVIRVQDAMPESIRNSPEWRQAAVGIAGSANPAMEGKRIKMLLGWMRDALSDKAVLASIPELARSEWDTMLNGQTWQAAANAAAAADADAYAYAAAADAAADAYAYAAAADAADAAAAYADAAAAAAATYAAADAFWERRDLAGMLRRLIEVQ